MKLSMLKKAVEDVLIRPPDLDEKKEAPKTPEADDGTSKAEKVKSEVNANSPEDGITEKGATWEQLDDVEQAYLVGFVGACKEASVDPTLFIAPDLAKAAGDPVGAGAISAIQRAAMTPAQEATHQLNANRAWGNRGFWSRTGQRIIHPIRSSRAASAWKAAPAQVMQGSMLGMGANLLQGAKAAPAAAPISAVPGAPQPKV